MFHETQLCRWYISFEEDISVEFTGGTDADADPASEIRLAKVAKKESWAGTVDNVLFPDQPLGLTVDHDQPDSSSLKFLALDMWQSAIFIEAIFYRAKLIETED